MEDVRKITTDIMKRKKWKKYQFSDSESDSDSGTDSSLELSDTDDTNDSYTAKKSVIKRKNGNQKTKKEPLLPVQPFKREGKKTKPVHKSVDDKKQDSQMQEMMNQFKNMTLMLQEVVQSNKQVVNPVIRTTTCRNCQVQGHDAAYCTKPCKICKGNDGTHVF
jgi:DnaJ-class molecular chaperone